MHYTMVSCAKCKRVLEVRMLGLSSGLGPSTIMCGKCGTTVELQRKEWDSLRWTGRLRFAAMSIGEVGGLALGGALAGGAAWPVPGVTWGDRVLNDSPGFLIGAVLFSILGVGLQVHRIIASRRRGRSAHEVPFGQSWLELQTNLQLKASMLVLLVGVVGCGGSYLLYPWHDHVVAQPGVAADAAKPARLNAHSSGR